MVDLGIKVEDLGLDPLQEIDEKARKAMRDTASDWGKKGNTIVKRHVRSKYKVKAGKISEASRGFKMTGDMSGHIEYTGGVISIPNFSFSPKGDAGRRIDATPAPATHFRRTMPAHGGANVIAVRQPNPYGITVRVKGGGSFPAGSNAFIYNGAPWIREGSAIKKMHGPSVPTMVDHVDKEGMAEDLAQMAEERLTHNLKRHLG